MQVLAGEFTSFGQGCNQAGCSQEQVNTSGEFYDTPCLLGADIGGPHAVSLGNEGVLGLLPQAI